MCQFICHHGWPPDRPLHPWPSSKRTRSKVKLFCLYTLHQPLATKEAWIESWAAANRVSLQSWGLCEAFFCGVGYHIIGSRQYVAHPNYSFNLFYATDAPVIVIGLGQIDQASDPPQELHQTHNFPGCSSGFHSALQESQSRSEEDQETNSKTGIHNSWRFHPTSGFPSQRCLEEKLVPRIVVVWQFGALPLQSWLKCWRNTHGLSIRGKNMRIVDGLKQRRGHLNANSKTGIRNSWRFHLTCSPS